MADLDANDLADMDELARLGHKEHRAMTGPVRNVCETAEYLRVSESTVRALMSAGDLPHRRIGRGRLVTTQDDIDEYLAAHRIGGPVGGEDGDHAGDHLGIVHGRDRGGHHAAFSIGASPAATKDLVAEVRRLRALLARCVDHIDPNDSDDAYRLLVECEEASRG